MWGSRFPPIHLEIDVKGRTAVLRGVGRELRYLGCVEWGVRRGVDALMEGAQLREDAPFVDLRRWRDVTWLEPQLIAEVSYSEIVEGRLRAAVYRGLVAPGRTAVNVKTTATAAAASQ